MKKNLKYILGGVGVAVCITACWFGGQALADQTEQKQLAKLEQQRQDQAARESTQAAQESLNVVPEVKYELPIPAPTPTPTPKPSAVPKEIITEGEDGTITITPNFETQAEGAVKIVTPGTEADANLGSGKGGDLLLGEDGVYHGDAPATPAPVVTPKPVINTPVLSAAPIPDQGTDPTQTTKPAPEPSSAPQGGEKAVTPGGPPSRDGKYDGEISPDGKYGWIGGFGWIERGGSDGGIGGQIDDSEFYAPGSGLTGNKVGSM